MCGPAARSRAAHTDYRTGVWYQIGVSLKIGLGSSVIDGLEPGGSRHEEGPFRELTHRCFGNSDAPPGQWGPLNDCPEVVGSIEKG
jgi:hypothetical protein